MTALTWSWLNVLTKKRYEVLSEVYGDLDTALEHVDGQLLRSLGCREETIMSVLNRLEKCNAESYSQELEKRAVTLISIEDTDYPAQLENLPDPPIFLYYRGDLSVLEQPCIAVVGTRAMSHYGKRVVEVLIPPLVQAQLVTVSGLAKGIDAHCARETLVAGGRTVAVLGHGLGTIHPQQNARLAEEIVGGGGLLLSEFPLDAPPDTYTFPARNRIIAGLSLGTVILEAGEGSGALITAELALEYGREVFAVPGQVFDENYSGCHQLIARGHAKLIQSAEDVLQEFQIVVPESVSKAPFVPGDPAEQAVHSVLTTMPQSVGELVERSGLPAAQVNAVLTMMELKGGAKRVERGMWVRV